MKLLSYLVACLNISFSRLNYRIIHIKKYCFNFTRNINTISAIKFCRSHMKIAP